MMKPDYSGGSIVNLMASLSRAMGGGDTGYPPTPLLDPAELAQARNILLLVIDGLGYNYLQQRGGAMRRQLAGSLTSVAPSTTASAIPVFLTARAPLQHGFTGWFTYFPSLGSLLTVLPFQTRVGRLPLEGRGLDPGMLSGVAPLFGQLEVSSRVVSPDWIVGSAFNRSFCRGAESTGYRELPDMFRLILRQLRRSRGRNYLYAYWPGFDSIAHEYGVGSREAEEHFRNLDTSFASLLAQLQGTDTLVLVTADHGFIDTTPKHTLRMEQYPELAETLLIPPAGEPRFVFCYVRHDRRQAFEAIIEQQLGHAAELLPSNRLLEQGWFGSGAAHPEFAGRIGDYALLMRDNYILTATLPGELPLQQVGVHGGVSEDEMRVPLVRATC